MIGAVLKATRPSLYWTNPEPLLPLNMQKKIPSLLQVGDPKSIVGSAFSSSRRDDLGDHSFLICREVRNKNVKRERYGSRRAVKKKKSMLIKGVSCRMNEKKRQEKDKRKVKSSQVKSSQVKSIVFD